MTQYARPDGDLDPQPDGSQWEGFAMGMPPETLSVGIDESSTDDNDGIQSGESNGEAPGSRCEVTLSNITDPNVHTNHIIKFRAHDDGSGVALIVHLIMGTTVIASTTANFNGEDTDWEDFESDALSDAEVTNIGAQSGYNDLRLRFQYIDDAMDGDNVYVSQAWFETPDVSAGGGGTATSEAFLLFLD